MFNGIGVGIGLCGTTPGMNFAPAVTTSDGATTYVQNAAAVVVDGALTVVDADDPNLASATVAISGGFQAGDVLAGSDGSGITWSWNAGTHVLTGAGSASRATWQTKLREVTFAGTSGDETPRVVTFRANDGDGESAGATKSIAYLSQPSLAVPGTQTMTEGGLIDSLLPVPTYAGADDLEVVVSCEYGETTFAASEATVTNNGSGSVTITGTKAEVFAELDLMFYYEPPSSSFAGVDTITLTIARDGQAVADTKTITVNVAPLAPDGSASRNDAGDPTTEIEYGWNTISAAAVSTRVEISTVDSEDDGDFTLVSSYGYPGGVDGSDVVGSLDPNTYYKFRFRNSIGGVHSAWDYADTTTAPDLTAGLFAYYRLADANDSSGNGRNLTNNNAVTFSAQKIGDGASLSSGSSQYLKHADASLWDSFTEGSFTVTGWYNATSWPYAAIICSRYGVTAVPFTLAASPLGTGKLYFERTNTAGTTVYLESVASLSAGWHYFLIEYNASNNTISLELDGAAPVTAAVTGNTKVGDKGFAIGARVDGGNNFNGKIDEVKMWTRVLTVAEKIRDYNQGVGTELKLRRFNPASVATLRGWYDFNDVSTLYQDTAGTSPVTTSGQTIRRIDNKVAGGPYFSQSTGPTYNTFNGAQMGAVFNGSSQFLVSSDTNYWKFLSDGTRYVVMMQAMQTALPASGNFYLDADNNSVSLIGPQFYVSGGANYNIGHRAANGTTNWINATSSNNAIVLNTEFVWTTRVQDSISGSDLIMRIGGTQVGTADRSAAPNSGNPSYPLTIGRLASSAAGYANFRLRRLWIWELPSNYPDDFIPQAELEISDSRNIRV